MSNASNRNLAASVRERDRRTALSLESPGEPGVAQAGYLSPSWDAFYGSLREQGDAAGGGYRLAGNGLSMPEGGTTRPGDEDTARTLGINAYLGHLTDEQRFNAEGLKQAQAQSSLANTAAAGAAADLTDRQTMDRALTGGGPVDRARLLASVPGHLRPQVEAQLAAADAKTAEEAMATRKQNEVERENKAKDAATAPFVPPVDPATGAPLTGAAMLQTLPQSKQRLVQAVLDGRQAIPSGAALKDPYWKGLIETANLVDPTFDTTDYNARSKTRQDFTSGKAAGQINSLNTVIGHLSDLADTGNKLGNGDMNWLNAVHNKLTPGGSERGVNLNNFETLKEGVANELMRVWRQVGAGSEKEIEDWKAQIGSTKSPQELQGAFKTIGGMLESKLGALDSQYKQGMGTDKVSAIMPASRAKLDRLQGIAGAPRTAAPAAHGAPGAPSGGGVLMQPPGDGQPVLVHPEDVAAAEAKGAKRVQ